MAEAKIKGNWFFNQDTTITNTCAYYKGCRTPTVAGKNHTHTHNRTADHEHVTPQTMKHTITSL